MGVEEVVETASLESLTVEKRRDAGVRGGSPNPVLLGFYGSIIT